MIWVGIFTIQVSESLEPVAEARLSSALPRFSTRRIIRLSKQRDKYLISVLSRYSSSSLTHTSTYLVR